MVITVSNCQQCPFCNDDNEFGRDQCNLNTNIKAGIYYDLPADKVHLDCPLLKNSYTITL